MGVKDLMKTLRSKCPQVLHASAPVAVEGDVWIDAPLLVMAALKKAEADGHDALSAVEASLRRTWNMVQCLEPKRVHWVFDGKARQEKAATVLQRQEAQEKYSESCHLKARNRTLAAFESFVADDDLELAETMVASFVSHKPISRSSSEVFARAKQVAATLGTVHFATHDSEQFIARSMKETDLAITSDSDALPFGCKYVVQHFGSSAETWILLDEVLDALCMTLETFQMFCVLLGTDFNPRLFKCGPAKALTAVAHQSFSLQTFATQNAASVDWLEKAQLALSIFQEQLTGNLQIGTGSQTDRPPREPSSPHSQNSDQM